MSKGKKRMENWKCTAQIFGGGTPIREVLERAVCLGEMRHRITTTKARYRAVRGHAEIFACGVFDAYSMLVILLCLKTTTVIYVAQKQAHGPQNQAHGGLILSY
jgi:hypothetical protein